MHERVYDAFLEQVTEQAKGIHAGAHQGAHFGPMTMPGQVEVVRRHVNDALAKGARAILGGPEAVGDRFVQPVVLTDVPRDSCAITEETFGPTMTVTRVRDMDEAVELERHRLRSRLDGLLQGTRDGAPAESGRG